MASVWLASTQAVAGTVLAVPAKDENKTFHVFIVASFSEKKIACYYLPTSSHVSRLPCTDHSACGDFPGLIGHSISGLCHVTRHVRACVRVCQVTSQLTAAVGTADRQRTVDSPSDQRQHLSDDDDGHLLYGEGTVLNDRCKSPTF